MGLPFTGQNVDPPVDVSRLSSPDAASGSGTARTPTAASGTPGRLARFVAGCEGGLLATLAMTAYRLPVSRSLPPTDRFWSRLVARDDESHPVAALALHLLYGAAAGGVFGALVPVGSGSDDAETTARREVRALALGVGYGLALSAFGERAVLGGLLGMDLDADERLVFHVGHVVYGLTLGTWLGSRTSQTPVERVSRPSP